MSPQECLAWRDGLTSSKFATTYYPWVTVFDAASGTQTMQPASGFVAGAWARNDAELGVGSAPTGRLRHAVGLVRQVTDPEQGLLNPRGVNCLRVFRGSGPVIWGARTLSDDSEWRYLNVRRLFNYIGDAQNSYPIWNATPLVALDVYEHAYFLDFQTDRGAYIDAFFANLDWAVVNDWVSKYQIPL